MVLELPPMFMAVELPPSVSVPVPLLLLKLMYAFTTFTSLCALFAVLRAVLALEFAVLAVLCALLAAFAALLALFLAVESCTAVMFDVMVKLNPSSVWVYVLEPPAEDTSDWIARAVTSRAAWYFPSTVSSVALMLTFLAVCSMQVW